MCELGAQGPTTFMQRVCMTWTENKRLQFTCRLPHNPVSLRLYTCRLPVAISTAHGTLSRRTFTPTNRQPGARIQLATWEAPPPPPRHRFSRGSTTPLPQAPHTSPHPTPDAWPCLPMRSPRPALPTRYAVYQNYGTARPSEADHALTRGIRPYAVPARRPRALLMSEGAYADPLPADASSNCPTANRHAGPSRGASQLTVGAERCPCAQRPAPRQRAVPPRPGRAPWGSMSPNWLRRLQRRGGHRRYVAHSMGHFARAAGEPVSALSVLGGAVAAMQGSRGRQPASRCRPLSSQRTRPQRGAQRGALERPVGSVARVWAAKRAGGGGMDRGLAPCGPYCPAKSGGSSC